MKPKKSQQEIALTPLAKALLEKRYLRKNAQGRVIETPEGMFRRVATHIAQAEKRYGGNSAKWAKKFYSMMAEIRFLPSSPCLLNAGTELGQLAACFVLPVEDSLDSIFATLREAALIHKSGGGTGFSFSRLRPRGDVVASTHGVSSGPMSFMRLFNNMTDEVRQGGRRRGANMGVLRVDHPDILDFINAKRADGALENFNLSVAVTDDFMQKAYAGEQYDLVNPRTAKPCSRLNAKRVLDRIVEAAWENGEPGLIFLDAIARGNPTPHLGLLEATNPCAEQPLLPYESCVLGSVNLARMVDANGVNWDLLNETAETAVRFLDDAIDVTRYPLPEIERVSKGNRKIGLGVMGFADLLYMLGIPYDSEQAVELGEGLMEAVSVVARAASEELAEQRGPFPNFEGSVYDLQGAGRIRNATRTTIAPTGSLSLIAGVSSGIEPNFALVYERLVIGGDAFMVNPVFERVARQKGFWRPDLMKEILDRGGLNGIKDVPRRLRRVFVTAHDIAPRWHVRMQAAFQKRTDNAVSKTVNLPIDASHTVVGNVLVLAWKLGCKGITVYRDRSRPNQESSQPMRRPRSRTCLPHRPQKSSPRSAPPAPTQPTATAPSSTPAAATDAPDWQHEKRVWSGNETRNWTRSPVERSGTEANHLVRSGHK